MEKTFFQLVFYFHSHSTKLLILPKMANGINLEPYDIAVVGTGVQDIISYAPRVPNPGESIQGSSFTYGFGGKGANQIIMAARLGAKTAMIGKYYPSSTRLHLAELPCKWDHPDTALFSRPFERRAYVQALLVGNDLFGKSIIDNFKANKVNVDNVYTTNEAATATAAVTVDEAGQNSIVGQLGASLLLTVDDVRRAELKIIHAKVLLCQLEVKEECTVEAMKIARKNGVITIFNPSPNPKKKITSDDVYQYSDIICLNEAEATSLTGINTETDDDIDLALKWFLDHGCKLAILTLGEKGCAVASDIKEKVIRIEVPKVKVVDTTGAGDAFTGSLAYFIACCPQFSLEERIRRASLIATLIVQASGTQTSYPNRDQIPSGILN